MILYPPFFKGGFFLLFLQLIKFIIMKINALILFFFLATISVHSQNAELQNCYTIAVGKSASADGKTVFLAHNEDDAGNMIVNLHKTKGSVYNKNDSFKLMNETKIPQVNRVNSLIWIETTQQNFGDFFINEYGVSICSNSCPSREDKNKGKLSYDFRRLMAERAKTAKQAVKIGGELLQKYGYASSGRTYTIADANEVWLMSVVQGKHWVAKRVPDNQVAVLPNYYTISEVNLNDTDNYLASADIVTYAIERGWYNPELEDFSFRRAYSSRKVLHASWNVPRHWVGLNILSEKQYGIDDDLPFSFVPKHKIEKKDLETVLSNHYENTDLAVNKDLHQNPHKNMIHTVCNQSTKFSVIAELKSTQVNSTENILWWAPLNPCVFPYIPILLNTGKFPEMYSNISPEKAKDQHFNEDKTSYHANPNHAYSQFNLYNLKSDEDYWRQARLRKTKLDDFNTIIDGKMAEKIAAPSYSYYLLVKLYEEFK